MTLPSWKILVVDDVDSNRFVLRDIIQEMGCQPVLTENGAQALKMVGRLQPQLIILDVAMPEMDGYEVCKLLKENPETRDSDNLYFRIRRPVGCGEGI